MILVINVCSESLHYHEFVSPVLNILGRMGEDYFVCNYDKLSSDYLEKADKIIICGTSLHDNEYLEKISLFSWIRELDKPILGICAGSQIIQIVFGGELKKIKEIGQIDVNFDEIFLGMSGERKVYSLHQNVVVSDDFFVYAKSDLCPHAMKHKNKEIYACLFHPEVYNHEVIEEFCRI